MKNVIKFAFGFTILPILSMSLFVLLNWILSLLFQTDFHSLNHSEIWFIEGLLTLIFTVLYLTYVFDEN